MKNCSFSRYFSKLSIHKTRILQTISLNPSWNSCPSSWLFNSKQAVTKMENIKYTWWKRCSKPWRNARISFTNDHHSNYERTLTSWLLYFTRRTSHFTVKWPKSQYRIAFALIANWKLSSILARPSICRKRIWNSNCFSFTSLHIATARKRRNLKPRINSRSRRPEIQNHSANLKNPIRLPKHLQPSLKTTHELPLKNSNQKPHPPKIQSRLSIN